LFDRLIQRLTDASIDYLVAQLEAGAECVQVFDTWAGVLSSEQFSRWCITPMRNIVAGVRAEIPDAKIIGFPRGAGMLAWPYINMTGGINAIGLDWTYDRPIASEMFQAKLAVQGNVDPLALLAGAGALDREVDEVLKEFSSGPHIFNLGHGILPETPVAHVERMLKRIRG
jgi:uroporphyrinogen decarboxylase